MTDFDRDGTTDADEFLAGTNPRIPYLTGHPLLGGAGAGNQRVHISFLTELNVSYRVETSDSLMQPSWTPASFAIYEGAPLYREVLVGNGNMQTIELSMPSSSVSIVRIKVTE
jgi:hypothetical protein